MRCAGQLVFHIGRIQQRKLALPHVQQPGPDFCGHGLGRLFHDAPEVIHAAQAGTGPVLKPGMFFTIEPMINLGKAGVKLLGDGWTAVTRDKSLSAQFEHSIAITETGNEIFTLSPRGLDKPPY